MHQVINLPSQKHHPFFVQPPLKSIACKLSKFPFSAIPPLCIGHTVIHSIIKSFFSTFLNTNSINGRAALLLDLRSVRLFSGNNTNGIQMINKRSFFKKKTSLASENWRLKGREQTEGKKPPRNLLKSFLIKGWTVKT